MKIFKSLGLAIVCAAAMGAADARAGTIYTYTGNPFNHEVGEYAPPPVNSYSVSGWFEVASPLGDDFGSVPGTPIDDIVVAFSFTDGLQTLTNSRCASDGGCEQSFQFSTDMFGNPNHWIIDIEDDGGAGGVIRVCNYGGTGGCGGGLVRDLGLIDNVNYGETVNNPGSWSVSSTPLPAALPLFAGGLGALGLLGWRRKRKDRTAIAA